MDGILILILIGFIVAMVFPAFSPKAEPEIKYIPVIQDVPRSGGGGWFIFFLLIIVLIIISGGI